MSSGLHRDSSAAEINSPVTSVPLLDVTRGNTPLMDEIFSQLRYYADSGRFIGGEPCQQLEKEVAEYCGASHAIGCASGSDALLLSLMAFDIGPGDEVIVPSFTFFATASCVTRLGATPVWVDIDPISYNLDPNAVREAITPQTKAIIPVHLFGQCAEMGELLQIASDHDIYLVEDAAQAIGAEYGGQRAGGLGDVGCISFYPTKNLGGFGDAGMVTTQRDDVADKLRLLANHGMKPRYFHSIIGINSRLDTFQAIALGIKLRHLDSWAEARRENAARYDKWLREMDLAPHLELPSSTVDGTHVWNQYTVRVVGGARDAIRESMQLAGVGTEIYYPIPLHAQKCFEPYAPAAGSLPHTDKAALEVISLPIFPELTEAEQIRVVECLGAAIDEHCRPVRRGIKRAA